MADDKIEAPPTIMGPCFVFENDGHTVMLEEIYNTATGLASFVKWKDGCATIVDNYENTGVVMLPRMDDGVRKGIIVLPDGVDEYVNTEEILTKIRVFIKKWVDISEDYLEFCSWYVLLSWVHDRFNVLNYLRVMGDFGTGKSRFLDVVGGICYRAMNASGATTAAAVARLIEFWKGTLILNEADWEKSDEKQDIVRILNEGYEKQRAVIKAHIDKQKELIYYNVFGPKILATRNAFEDQALESRCLTEVMAETQRTDICPVLLVSFFDERRALLRKLLMWRFKNWHKITETHVEKVYPELVKRNIEKRLIQSTVTFTVLFADDPYLMERFFRFIEKYQTELRDARAQTTPGMIVNSIYSLVIKEDLIITASKIAEEMINQGWSGDPPSPRTIGKHLRTLQLSTKLKREGGSVSRVMVIDVTTTETLKRLIMRYVPLCNVVTFVTVCMNATNVQTTLEGSPDVCGCNVIHSDVTNVIMLQNHKNDVTNVTDTNVTNVTNVTKHPPIPVLFLQDCPEVVDPDGKAWGSFKAGETAEINPQLAVSLERGDKEKGPIVKAVKQEGA